MAKVQAKRRGLGMGLSALFGDDEAGMAPERPARQAGQRHLPIEFLRPSPLQPRRNFAEAEIEALAGSLREHGVLQPLLVRPVGHEENAYEIIAGERRWRAAQRAGLAEVPVMVRELDDVRALEVALVENVQREDLSPLEEAMAFRRLMDEFGHTQEVLAEAVGKSRSHIANTLRLLGLPEPVRAMLERGELSAGHARALLGVAEPQAIAGRVVAEGLSVRQTEALSRAEVDKPAPAARAAVAVDPNVRELERQLASSLGLEVAIRSRGPGGAMTIRWGDHAQLENLLSRLRKNAVDN